MGRARRSSASVSGDNTDFPRQRNGKSPFSHEEEEARATCAGIVELSTLGCLRVHPQRFAEPISTVCWASAAHTAILQSWARLPLTGIRPRRTHKTCASSIWVMPKRSPRDFFAPPIVEPR